MKVTGVIAEYNIFHNGHKYQIDKIKSNSDAVVAVMSGSFVQRGAVAIADKWTRAKAALMCGVDLVIELPVIYSLNTAQKFAQGAISILDALGTVDELCFGSECGDIEALCRAAEILDNEPKEVSAKIKSMISKGKCYPAAIEAAYDGIIPNNLFAFPNNILAIEYIRAINAAGSRIKPVTIKRRGAAHDSAEADNGFASASAIRKMMTAGEDISEFIPPEVFEIMKNADAPYSQKNLDAAVTAVLRMADTEYLAKINDVSEGLENRIKAAAASAASIEEIADKIKTKRYTRTRINRIIFSALLGLTKDLCALPPYYIRVLGMNSTGRILLREINEKCALPVIIKTADYKKADRIFKAEMRATDIASLCSPDTSKRVGGRDFITPPEF